LRESNGQNDKRKIDFLVKSGERYTRREAVTTKGEATMVGMERNAHHPGKG